MLFEFELDSNKKEKEDIKPDFGPVGSIVDIRTYRRWLPVSKRRETFVERNERVTDANLNLVRDIITEQDYELERSIMLDHMNKLLALPSGRSMWIAGTTANKKHPASSFNCSALAINRIEAFTTVFELLMLGTGVGFRVFSSDINKLPNINKFNIEFEGYNPKAKQDRLEDTTAKIINSDTVYVEVGDSRKGWIDSLDTLLRVAFNTYSSFELHDTLTLNFDIKKIVFNFNSVRPLGERINGFGGTASGHEALKNLLKDVADIINQCPTDKLRSIDCLDICCAIAKGVVAGNTRRCLPKGTLVSTEQGLKAIEDITTSDKVYASDGNTYSVLNTFKQGVQKVARINTNGTPFYATANHRMAVLKDAKGSYEWKTVAELKEGDRLLHNLFVVDGVSTSLPVKDDSPRPQHSTTCKDFVVPQLTEEVAWFIGYFHGNGYVNNRKANHRLSVTMHSKNTDLAERVKQGFELFGEDNVIINKRPNENTLEVSICNTRLGEYFYEHIKQANTELKVPSFILEAVPSIRAAYLAGLFDSDGCDCNRPISLVSTIYKDFVEQVAALYSSLGIPSRLRSQERKEANWKDLYTLSLIGFRKEFNEIIAIHSSKDNLSIQSKPQCGYSVPKEFVLNELSRNQWMKVWQPNKDMNFETYNKIGGSLTFVPITVTSIDYDVKEVETYDIEVETVHEFFANGILTHNSALICIFEEGDDLMANAKVDLFNNPSLKPKYYRIQSNNTEALGSKYLDQLRAYLESNPDVSKEELWKFIDQYKPSIEWLKQRFKVVANAGDPGFANYLKMVGTKWLAVRKYRPDFDIKKIWEYFCDICTNPCSEIILSVGYKDGKGVGFCNLTTLPINKFVIKKCNNNDLCAVTGYKLDDVSLEKAVRLTVRMATRQTFVDMPRVELDSTQKAERLLGVSITGWIQLFAKLDLSYKEQEELMVKINGWANNEADIYSVKLGIERPLMVCCVKPEGCGKISHIRTTTEGLLRVDEIGNVSKLGFNKVDTDNTTTKGFAIRNVYNNGLSRVVKIKLNNGRELVFTLQHPFSVNGLWKNAINLKKGDVLDIELDTYNKLTNESLADYNAKYNHLRKEDLSFPKEVTNDLSWWVASIFANGSVNTNRISFCSGYIEVVQKFVDLSISLFSITTTAKKDKLKDMYRVDIVSTDLIEYLKLNGLLKTKDFTIPLIIRRSSREALLSFICGYLDNDGCFKNSGCSITTKNEDFARMLQEVGEAVGLSFSCYDYTRETTKGVGSYFDLQLSRTYSTNRAIDFINSNSIKAKLNGFIISTDKSHKNPYKVNSVEVLEELINTYDIEVDDPHWYYQGGIKSHNTGSKVLGSSSGVHWDWAPYYILRIQMGANDALAKTLKQQGFSWVPTQYDLGKIYPTVDIWQAIELFRQSSKEDKELMFNSCNAVLFEFPISSGMVESQGSVSASRQLQNVLRFTDKYVDHMVSSTISAKEHEWDNLAEELHAEKNWSRFINAAFLSYYSGNHPLLPNDQITEEEYNNMMAAFKDSEWVKDGKFYVNEDLLAKLEQEALGIGVDIDDVDLGSACSTGQCPLR